MITIKMNTGQNLDHSIECLRDVGRGDGLGGSAKWFSKSALIGIARAVGPKLTA
jgi:hypothetical protein